MKALVVAEGLGKDTACVHGMSHDWCPRPDVGVWVCARCERVERDEVAG